MLNFFSYIHCNTQNEYSYDDEIDGFGDYDEFPTREQSHFDLNLTTSDPSVASSSTSGGAIIPNGAVCVASGRYHLDHNTVAEPTAIPRAICITPPSVREEDVGVQLGVVCGGGVVEMTSLTSFQHTTNITLHLTCLNSREALDEVHTYTYNGQDIACYCGSILSYSTGHALSRYMTLIVYYLVYVCLVFLAAVFCE